MHSRGIFLILLLQVTCHLLFSQESSDPVTPGKSQIFSGFVRGGFYGDLKDNADKPFITSAFADLGLKADYNPGSIFRAFADVRLRYGSEFHEPVSIINLREGFVELTGKKLSFSAGKRIIKWGRADFTNPTSRLNPQNYISRSPDREDMDLGNILADINWFPARAVNFQAVAVPLYSPSVLIIDPVPFPEYVKIEQLPSLVTGQELFSYGLKADIHLQGIDIGLSWFDGYDPMPGIEFVSFNADLSGEVPVISESLKLTPFSIMVAGFDFETSVGMLGWRGEAAWSQPDLLFSQYEYVPFPEIKWVTGLDISLGNLRVSGEYSGKSVLDYTPSPVDPVFGAETDFSELLELIMTPGFDLDEYMRQQIGAFNRLYNYQLERNYHSAGLRIETDLSYGKILPSVFTMYNFTSRDFLVIPEIRVKPGDGLTLTLGAEIYSGKKNSLYDIVDDFMTSIYVGLRADF